MSSYTETPAVACVVSGFLAGLLALLVSLRDLIEMMSIGTLLAYTLVRLHPPPSARTPRQIGVFSGWRLLFQA